MTRWPPCPHLTVCLEAIYHHLPLSLILPEVSEDVFLIRIILTDSFQAALDVSRV
jgi:hypothetical protein